MLQAGSKRRRTKKQIEAEKQAEVLKRQQTEAKVTNYNAMQMKVSMLEQEREKANAAADLVQQFIDAGFAKQGSDGHFTIPGASETKKFKPFGGK